jgi:hypothetical protein
MPSCLKTIEIHPFIRRILIEAAAKVYGAVRLKNQALNPAEIPRRTADRNLTSIEEHLAGLRAERAALQGGAG